MNIFKLFFSNMNLSLLSLLSSKKLIGRWLLIISIIFSSLAQAETVSQATQKQKQRYIVEVILFKHLNEQGKNNEHWNESAAVNEEEYSIHSSALAEYDLNSRSFTPLNAGITKLSRKYYQLTDSAQHIKYSHDFQFLAHFGWIQNALSKRRSLPVLIKSDQFSNNLLPNGDLTLYVSRFLHLKVQLSAADCVYYRQEHQKQQQDELAVETNTNNEVEQELNDIDNAEKIDDLEDSLEVPLANECINISYQMDQNRKMRSKELHYIDHPVFGLLVNVTPVKKDES